jgi:hypothetical protein
MPFDGLPQHAPELRQTNDLFFTALAKHKASNDPELAYQIISTAHELGLSEAPDYLSPVFLAVFDSPGARRIQGHVTAAAGLHPLAGFPVASAAVELSYFIEADKDKRKQAGLNIINTNHESLFSVIDRLPAIRRTWEELSEHESLSEIEKNRFREGVKKLEALDKNLPNPDASRDVMAAYAGALQSVTTAFPKEVAQQLIAVINSTKTSKEAIQAIRQKLEKIENKVDSLKISNEELSQLMNEVQQSDKANRQDKTKKMIAEVNAYGQVIGMIVGINDPQAGRAVETLVTSMTKLYEAKEALSTAFSMAAFSGGLGAAFAIAGALGVLGGRKSGGADSTTVILGAVREIAQRIEALSRQVHKLDEKLTRFIELTEVNFSVMAFKLDSIETKIDLLQLSIRDVAFQDIARELDQALNQYAYEDDPIKKRIELTKLSELCLSIGFDYACYDLYTGLNRTSEIDFGKKMSDLNRDLKKVADSTKQQELYEQFISNSLLRFLELNPFAVWMALNRLHDDLNQISDQNSSEELEQKKALLDAISWPPSQISDKAKIKITQSSLTSLTGSKNEIVHPLVALRAFEKLLDPVQDAVLTNADGLNEKANQSTPSNFRDLYLLLQWYERVVAMIGIEEFGASVFREDYSANWDRSLELVIKARIGLNKPFCTNNLAVNHALALGFTRIKVAEDQSDVIDPYLPTPLPWTNPTWTPDWFQTKLNDESTLERLFDCAKLARRFSLSPGLESIAAWTDAPYGGKHPSWVGQGDYHEVYQFRVSAEPNSGSGETAFCSLQVLSPKT